MPPSPLPSLNLTHQDLLNTANELYRRMEDPGFAQDDAYWTSLPIHLRNFIRNALPLAGNVSAGSGVLPGGVHAAGGQRAMYALAQQIVSAANTGMGIGAAAAAMAASSSSTPAPSNMNAVAPPMSLDDLATMPPEAMLAYNSTGTTSDPRQYGFYTHPDHAAQRGMPGMPGVPGGTVDKEQDEQYLHDDE